MNKSRFTQINDFLHLLFRINMSQNLSGNYLDYMDGVPVKISEKYKPPPIITLPYGIIESTTKSSEVVESIHYDFSLENNVLKKLIEWQNARETERNERNHRLQLLEEAKQREQDLKAATENEERLKQLSISEVSYPSTEEISEISPDDMEESKPQDNQTVPVSHNSEQTNQQLCQQITSSEGHTENTLSYGNCMVSMYSSNQYLESSKPEILQPTPVSPHRTCAPTNLLDDPDPIQQFQQSITNKSHHKLSYIRPSYMKNNVDNLTFSDFENDTSSPFDNMELKTINDLELLAQVLNTNQSIVHHTNMDESYGKQPILSQPSNGFTPTQTYSATHSTNNADVYSPKSAYVNTQDLSSTMAPYTFTPRSMAMNNGYYDSSGNEQSSFSHTGMTNVGQYYTPDYGYSVSNTMFQQIPNVSGYSQINDKVIPHNGQSEANLDTSNEGGNQFNQSLNNPYEYYGNYAFYPATTFNTTYSPPVNVNTSVIPNEEAKEEPSKKIGSRSRSVPDIVRELDEEVAEARQRARDRSHNCSPALQSAAVKPQSERLSPQEELPDIFPDLAPDLQSMCKHISAMGFPLTRVARACHRIGLDDKKVIIIFSFIVITPYKHSLFVCHLRIGYSCSTYSFQL